MDVLNCTKGGSQSKGSPSAKMCQVFCEEMWCGQAHLTVLTDCTCWMWSLSCKTSHLCRAQVLCDTSLQRSSKLQSSPKDLGGGGSHGGMPCFPQPNRILSFSGCACGNTCPGYKAWKFDAIEDFMDNLNVWQLHCDVQLYIWRWPIATPTTPDRFRKMTIYKFIEWLIWLHL